jgi:hypothetical protein
MKHKVTELNDLNEPVMFSNSILGNVYFKTLFGELEEETSQCMDSNEQSEILHPTQTVKTHYNIIGYCTKLDTKQCTSIVSSSSDFSL